MSRHYNGSAPQEEPRMYRPVLETWDDCNRKFSTTRSPEKGKPIRNWCRLFKNGQVFELKYNYYNGTRETIAEFHPDGRIVLPSSSTEWQFMHSSLSMALHGAIPILTERMGKGRYRIANTMFIDKKLQEWRNDPNYVPPTQSPWSSHYQEWWELFKTHGSEYFAGMTFNAEGECTNKRYSTTGEIDTEKRRVWLRMLRRFKRGLKARAKIGALQQHAKRIHAKHEELSRKGQSRWQWELPNFQSPKYYRMLKNALETNEFSPEFLDAFVESATPNTYGNTIATDAIILQHVDTIMNDLSYQLRREYGVFISEPLSADGKVIQR